MGYRVTPRVALVRLRGTEFDGAEVRADVPSAEVIATALDQGDRGLVAALGDHLIQWNLEDEAGEAIPCTPEALRALPNDLAASIAVGWWRASTRVQRDRPTPPPGPDTNGAEAGTVIEAL